MDNNIDIENNLNPYDYFIDQWVSVQGFVYSGSSAVCDYLREFNNVAVYSARAQHSGPGYQNNNTKNNNEMVFLRYLDPIKIINCVKNRSNKSRIDYELKRFILKCYEIETRKTSGIGFMSCFTADIDTAVVRRLLIALLCDLIKLSKHDYELIKNYDDFFFPISLNNNNYILNNKKGGYFNRKFYKDITNFSFVKNKSIVFYELKDDLNEFKINCIFKKFLEALFIRLINNDSILVLDQFLTCMKIEDNNQYLPNKGKTINVYRDPRDIYSVSFNLRHPYLPADPSEFCDFMLNRYETYLKENEFNLPICFEELVTSYKKETDKINKFLNLLPHCHRSPLYYFNPQISKSSIGIYNKHHNQKTMNYIKERFYHFYSNINSENILK